MNSVGSISVIGTQRVGQANSVGPIRSFRWDLSVTKGKQWICIADSVGLIRSSLLERNVTKRKQSVCIAISVGPIALSVWPKCYKGKPRDYNPIAVRPRSQLVRPKRLGFLAVAMSSETQWLRIWNFCGAELNFLVWDICGYEKVVRVLEHFTKHFEQDPH